MNQIRVTPCDRKHDYVHQNMTVHDTSQLIMTGLETCFKSEERAQRVLLLLEESPLPDRYKFKILVTEPHMSHGNLQSTRHCTLYKL